MTQHTQGEWTIDVVEYMDTDKSYATFNIRNSSDQLIVTSDEGLCNMADARLISAAPKLLAALENLLEEAYANMTGGKGHLLDEASAAIAAAKGEK